LHFQKYMNSWLNVFGVEQDPSRACYGMKHVEVANERLAVQTLLITDDLFRFAWYNRKICWVKDNMVDCSIRFILWLPASFFLFYFNRVSDLGQTSLQTTFYISFCFIERYFGLYFLARIASSHNFIFAFSLDPIC